MFRTDCWYSPNSGGQQQGQFPEPPLKAGSDLGIGVEPGQTGQLPTPKPTSTDSPTEEDPHRLYLQPSSPSSPSKLGTTTVFAALKDAVQSGRAGRAAEMGQHLPCHASCRVYGRSL